MLGAQPIVGLLSRHCTLRYTSKRFVFVMSNEKRNRIKKAALKSKHNPRHKLEPIPQPEPLTKAEQAQLLQQKQRLKEFKRLTQSVSQYLHKKPHTSNVPDYETPVEENEIEEVYRAISSSNPAAADSNENTPFDPLRTSLASPTVELPKAVEERLGLALKYLVRKDLQGWALVLRQLEREGGFLGLVERDVRKLIYAIPRGQLRQVFPQVEELLNAAGMAMSPKILNAYMKSVICRNNVNDEEIEIIEQCVDRLKQTNKKGLLSRDTYEVLIEAYGKHSSMDKVNEIILQMKEQGLEPLREVYANVLTTCVYKVRSHDAAVQLFDSMKFFLKKTQPSTREYQDIIVSHVNHDNIEKALDLYQEMLTDRIEINQKILVALARGCFAREEYKVKAWDFMFEIHRREWTPTAPTAEYMLYLALQDGDLPLARALYQQLNMSGTTSPRSFSFLLLAYAKASVEGGLPTIEFNEMGRRFRQNIIINTDLAPDQDDPKKALPFLPKLVLENSQEILAESSAIMAHTLLVNSSFVNIESANTFLNVAANVGTLEEFKERFDQFTYLDRKGIPETRSFIEPEHCLDEPNAESKTDSLAKLTVSLLQFRSPLLDQLLESSGGRFKVPRNTITYLIALKAAAKHKNYILAQTIWTERGLYRRSSNWNKLSRTEKDKLDFDFAVTMVNSLTQIGLLDDALAIIVSTEYQFKWKRHHFSRLYKEAVEIGNSKITQTLRGIAKRAQINFEGKIRRKDYKRFVMENGF